MGTDCIGSWAQHFSARMKSNLWYRVIMIRTIIVKVPWYIGLDSWLWIRRLRVQFLSMHGTYVLQLDISSTLLLSTQVLAFWRGLSAEVYIRHGFNKTNCENQVNARALGISRGAFSILAWISYINLCFILDFSTEMVAANQRPHTVSFASGKDHWTLHTVRYTM